MSKSLEMSIAVVVFMLGGLLSLRPVTIFLTRRKRAGVVEQWECEQRWESESVKASKQEAFQCFDMGEKRSKLRFRWWKELVLRMSLRVSGF